MKKYIETDKGLSLRQALQTGKYNIWNNDRIKGAFNFGNGSMKHFKEYMQNNKSYADFYKLED